MPLKIDIVGKRFNKLIVLSNNDKKDRFNKTAPYKPFLKTILQTIGQILGIHDSSEPTGAKGTNNPRGYAENNQKRNHCHQSYNFRKNHRRLV